MTPKNDSLKSQQNIANFAGWNILLNEGKGKQENNLQTKQ